MRLTIKCREREDKYEPSCLNPKTSYDEDIDECIQKLGQLEDVLEKYDMNTVLKLDAHLGALKESATLNAELGIDLITVGRILSSGIYVKTYLENGQVNIIFNSGKFNQIDKEEKCLLAFLSPHPVHLRFADYGKTWALTREELEK